MRSAVNGIEAFAVEVPQSGSDSLGRNLVATAESRNLGSHTIESNDHYYEKKYVGDSKHPHWKIIKEQLMKPMGDETVLVLCSGTVTWPNSIFPDCQRTHDTEYALDCDNANQEQVNNSEVKIANECPTSKMPDPNDR